MSAKKKLVNIEEDDDKLPEVVRDIKNNVHVERFQVTNTNTASYWGSFRHLGVDNSLDMSLFKKNFQIHVVRHTANNIPYVIPPGSSLHKGNEKTQGEPNDGGVMVLDLVHAYAPIVNALRRIAIAEVPTMCIERVVVCQNTSVLQDEAIAHRLGLIPLRADPTKFDFKPPYTRPRFENGEEFDENSLSEQKENDSIIFKLNVKCYRDPKTKELVDSKVYSSHLTWQPIGSQGVTFATQPIRPVHGDIIVAKLNPGQSIEVECYCDKNVGREHAKWSPVATTTYRLHPQITFKQPIRNEKAEELKKKCPMNVFDVEELVDGSKKAVVARPRDCTVCRECIREDDWDARVKLDRVKDHFIFSVESTGVLEPEEIFRQSIAVLKNKCQTIKDHLQKIAASE